MVETRQLHILVATYPLQGHINPAIHLANRIIATTSARVTFSTPVSAHRKMFPNLASPDQEFSDGAMTYIPFTDGYDDGFPRDDKDHSFTHVLSQFKKVGSSSLSSILDLLVSRSQPVDCVLYTFMLPWAADVAHSHGIPSAQYWIQPATVFAMYYHYFNSYSSVVNEHCKDPSFAFNLPGLQQSPQIRDLPTFITTTDSDDIVSSEVVETVKKGLEALRRVNRPKVLVNSFDELEADALFSSISDIELIGVGPVLQAFPTNSCSNGFVSLFKPDEKAYMEWLDTKQKKSVVYVSFGSMAVLKKSQVEEIAKGLKASGRPYLWVVRKDCRYEGIELLEESGSGDDGIVVEWCSQVRVLNHPSVGCFVTHCGWNSTLESLVSGVPTVGVPQWSDQGANSMLMEKVWGTGVRSEVDGDGVLRGEELARCLDLVLGDEERGVEIRRRAEVWKEKAAEAVAEGGSSDRNLKAFVQELAKFD